MQPMNIYCSSCGAGNQPRATFCFHCGAAMQIGTPPGSNATGRIPQGQMLNQRYRVVKLVGQGGMGAVYKAEDLKFGARTVALKEMSQSNLSPQDAAEAVEQFKQEAQMLAGLKHPNLPSIYDYFIESGRSYLVMDFIEGTTLEERLNKATGNRLSIPETLDIGIQLAKVLGYLHNRPSPIIFRDLKPLNIMITPDDNVYLIDFGIARLFKPGKTKDTISYVSAGYAAPEQYGRAQTSPQSDIYSLGATLHQLLSDYDPASNYPLFNFKPLQSYNPNVPTALAGLVAKMVSTDPAQRPANIAIVRKELEQIQMQIKQGYTPTYIPPQPVYNSTLLPPTPPSRYNPTLSSPPSPYYTSSGQVQQNKQIARPALSRGKVWKTLLIGIVVGVIPFAGIPLGSADIAFFAIAYLVAGMIASKIVVLRKMGLLTGFVAGLPVMILTLFFSPHYYYLSLSWAVVSSLLGLLGAWLSTIKHPYYKRP